jgi:hypothetical protein
MTDDARRGRHRAARGGCLRLRGGGIRMHHDAPCERRRRRALATGVVAGQAFALRLHRRRRCK